MISVIIPAYNAADTLPACLNALQTQTLPSTAFEVIVIDDGSADDTPRIARAAGVKLITQPNAGAAAARNAGAAAAQGDILLFTDADCIPAPNWIENMSAPFNNPQVAGVKGVYQTEQPNLIPRFVQMEYQDKYDRMQNLPAIDFVDTYSAGYRRSVFLQTGGFDTTFPGASVEDQEFSFRVAAAGHQLVFAPQAVVSHRHDISFSEYARRKFFIGYWKNLVLRRHPDKLTADSHTPQILKVQVLLAGLGAVALALAAALRQIKFLWMALGATVALLLSGFSLYCKIFRRDKAVLPIAPLMLLLRAVSLGAGLLWGFARLIAAK